MKRDRREYFRLYYGRNRERILSGQKRLRKEGRPWVKQRDARYNRTLRGRMRWVADIENRRARRHDVPGRVTTAEWLSILEAAAWKCHWCGIDINGNAHMDHVIAISKGGEHTVKNIVASCPECNRKRGASA